MFCRHLEAHLMEIELAEELHACFLFAMLASYLQGKLWVVERRAQAPPSAVQVLQQPLLITILAVQAHLQTVILDDRV